MIKRDLAIVIFKELSVANKYLQICEEYIINKDEFVKFERMKRRVWNTTDRKYELKNTNNLIVTMKGEKIRKSIRTFEGMNTELKVQPYVEPVIQCFKCYRYGHIKGNCRGEIKCAVCGEQAHGNCQKSVRCRNCGGNHKSISKVCPIYEKNTV